MRFGLAGLVFILLAYSGYAAAAPEASAQHAYRYYLKGNAADVQRATRGLLVLQGGGDDVDQNYVRMGEMGGGGDQGNSVRFWKGTPLQDSINFVVAKPAPIGGTSAGMAVAGEFVYSATGPDSLTTPTGWQIPSMSISRSSAIFCSCRGYRASSPISICTSAIASVAP